MFFSASFSVASREFFIPPTGTVYSGSAVAMSNHVSQFYKTSESRQKLVSTFDETNFKLDSLAVDVFKEQFGWEILKTFDDWELDIKRLHSEVKKNEQVHNHSTVNTLSHGSLRKTHIIFLRHAASWWKSERRLVH